MQNRPRDFLHYQVGHWLALLRWDAFNCILCFLIYTGTAPCPMSTHTPQVCGADSRQVCWWHKMWEGENVTFFEGKETQIQELIFRSKIGRNQLAHGFTFLSKVPLEVCGQGCVTEEAPEEWSSFNSSHAFVPLCFCAFVPLCPCAFVTWTSSEFLFISLFSGQKDICYVLCEIHTYHVCLRGK